MDARKKALEKSKGGGKKKEEYVPYHTLSLKGFGGSTCLTCGKGRDHRSHNER